MIVLTVKKECNHHIFPGDKFNLYVETGGKRDVLTEEFTRRVHINVFGAFRFVEDDGTLAHPHVCGFFGDVSSLPPELLNARRVEDLEEEQKQNFMRSDLTAPAASKDVTRLPSGIYVVDYFARFKKWLGL